MKLIETLKNIWKIEDLRKRLITTFLFIVIYRFGCHVVLPGINPADLEAMRNFTNSGLMQLLDMFSGGAFGQASIFALGIMPYITASIVIQLMGMVVPSFQKMQREGESGRMKLNQYTRYLTVAILLVQAPAYLMNLQYQVNAAGGHAHIGGWTMIYLSIVLTAGAMLIMWLGEKITDIDSAKKGLRLLLDQGVKQGIVTLGDQGCVFNDGEELCSEPARKVKAVDSTAAGDTFTGAVAVSLLEGKGIREAIRFATRASSITVTKLGAQSSIPSRDEVEAL